MVREIEITEEVWRALQERAEPLVDSLDDVLRKLLDLQPKHKFTRRVRAIHKVAPPPRVSSNLSPKAEGRRNRQDYVEALRAEGIRLTHHRRIYYRTQRGQTVAIPSATERQEGKWFLGLSATDFDEGNQIMVVLLCKGKNEMLDFVLPCELLAKVIPYLSRDKHNQFKFNVAKRSKGDFELLLTGRAPVNISQYLHRRGPLK